MNELTGTEPTYLPRGHSGLGIASCVIALVLLVSLVAAMSIRQYREDREPTLFPMIGRSNPDNAKFLRLQKVQEIGFYVIASGWPVGFLLGLLGMLQAGHNRLYALVGVVLHGAMAFLLMILYLAP